MDFLGVGSRLANPVCDFNYRKVSEAKKKGHGPRDLRVFPREQLRTLNYF